MSALQSSTSLDEKAGALLNSLIDSYDQTYGFGSMTCSIYDTAWVAMVSRTVDGKKSWSFPDTFRYLLDSQSSDGGWASYASEVDGILNTMAALLAVCEHTATPSQLADETPEMLRPRISRAAAFLQVCLDQWDVCATVHVGFEILVPTLLELLETKQITFDFKGRSFLMAIKEHKMSKFNVEMLYGPAQTTMVHSLEGFVGKIDFDRVGHHLISGSMMGSPSSTAAYMMCCTTWNKNCEAYIRHAIADGEGKGNGGLPSAFPSTNFEITWVLSTLMEGGFSPQALGVNALKILGDILETSFHAEHDLIGFAPFVGVDADDTAKAISTLNFLGRTPSPKAMIDTFEANDHFKTYALERNTSFSANCNVLNALLHGMPNSIDCATQIAKATTFLCKYWWDSNGQIRDKWNLSPLYPTMLMTQAFVRVLMSWDEGKIPILTEQFLKDQVIVVLFQAMVRVLQTQNPGGEWGHDQSRETTAYAILILTALLPLPFTEPFTLQIKSAISAGRAFLWTTRQIASLPEYLWIEKVTYGSRALSESFILAALKAPLLNHELGPKIADLSGVPMKNVIKFGQFYAQLPLYAGVPQWQVQASIIEGYLFLPPLKRINRDIFPKNGAVEDKYFEYIPFTWTGSNNMKQTFLGAQFLYDMMVISFLNYQADEYMETVVSQHFRGSLDEARCLINYLFEEVARDHPSPKMQHVQKNRGCGNNNENGTESTVKNGHESNGGSAGSIQTNEHATNGNSTKSIQSNGFTMNGAAAKTEDILKTLKRFVVYVLTHPGVKAASAYDQHSLRDELKVFLLAHIDQIDDSKRFSTQEIYLSSNTIFQSPNGSFMNWVRTTSSDHTSCPYAFAFVGCLLGRGPDFFKTVEEKYLGQDVCRHLATMCRIYNDYGSLARDRLEKNLNSINFPEFDDGDVAQSDEILKERLFRLACYERKCLDMSLAELAVVSKDDVVQAVRMFCSVTDTYGQIYVLKDIANRTSKLEA